MENYIWKYVDKLDGTIETASEKVMEQIDKYIKRNDENLEEKQGGFSEVEKEEVGQKFGLIETEEKE